MTVDVRLLRQHDRNLWSLNRPLSRMGADVGHRMTVIRLGRGDLVVHSPVALVEGVVDDLVRLGPVRYIIAPNKFHDLFLDPCFDRYPDAEFLGAPGFREKHPDLAFTGEIEEGAQGYSDGELEVVLIRGMPLFNECAFLHVPSRTLIVADLLFNLRGDGSTYFGRWLLFFLNVYRRTGTSRLFRVCIRDRVEFKRSFDRLLTWDFGRIIMGHGEVLETGGEEALRRAYDWL